MKTIHIIIIIVVVVAVGVVITTFTDSSTYANFSTAAANPDKEYHVIGTLSPGRELVYDAVTNPDLFSFYMKDEKGEEKRVIYHGAKPQDFEKSENVVIIGSMKSDTLFEASGLLLKCPSKYNEEDQPQQFGDKEF